MRYTGKDVAYDFANSLQFPSFMVERTFVRVFMNVRMDVCDARLLSRVQKTGKRDTFQLDDITVAFSHQSIFGWLLHSVLDSP